MEEAVSILKPCPNDYTEPVWNDDLFVDQISCPKCGRSTHSYYDGAQYAIEDWNHNRHLLSYGLKKPCYRVKAISVKI